MKESNLKNNETVKSYSEAFKFKVLRELSEGRLTKNEVIRKYKVSAGSLYYWIRKYNRLDLMNPMVKIVMPNDKDEKKRLQLENKKLKELLIQAQLKHLKSEADLTVALKQLGYFDRAEFEKKQNANRSTKL